MNASASQLAGKDFALQPKGEVARPLRSVPPIAKARRRREEGRANLSELTLDELRALFQMHDRYEPVLRYAHGTEARISLFFHAAYLENFGRSAPYSSIPKALVEHIAAIFGEVLPTSFVYPGARRTFFKHADKARRLLGFRRLDAKTRQTTQAWLFEQASRSDDQEHLGQLLADHFKAERIVLPAKTSCSRLIGQARERAQDWISQTIAAGLTEKQNQSVEALRELKPASHRTVLQWLKDSIPQASPRTLDDVLDRLACISAIDLASDIFETIHPDMRRRIAKIVQVYSVDNLYADFPVERRQSYVACYLYERKKALIDFAIETFDGVVIGMYRRSQADRDQDRLKHSPALNEKVRMFQIMARPVLNQDIDDTAIRSSIFEKIPRDELARALEESEGLVQPEDNNCFPYLERRYTYLRSFFPRFISAIDFECTPGAQPLVDAVAVLRALDAEGIRKLPDDAPCGFAPAKWKAYVIKDGGEIDRHYYELCVMAELHRALQSGEVWAKGGRRYGNVEDLLIPKETWATIRADCYKELGLPMDGKTWLAEFLPKLTTRIESTIANLANNKEAFVQDGLVHLQSLKAEPLPDRLKRLKERVDASWPQIRIQDLLVEVDSWLGFLGRFRTPRGRQAKDVDFLQGLLATLIAKGCNIGLVKMAGLAPGIRPGTLQRADEIYLHEENLRRAFARLLGAHNDLPIATLLGDETVSMSDGMRVTSRVKTLNAALKPHLLGPGERAITYYWHVSHQGPGFSAQVIGSERDATYVMDQLFNIQSELPVHEHYTDTHGATENTFALAYPFGIDFAPRIKRIFGQQLYHPPGMKISGPFKAHFAEPLNVALIEQHWDDYVRVLASIRRGTTSAVLLCQRLSSYADQNPIYRVIREVGRGIKTNFIMRYYDEASLRRRINTGLNRVELFNYLARHLFFARRGENWERDFEQQRNRASALLLLANACVLWNAVQLSEVFQRLRAEGFEFQPEDFVHVSPYAFEHIIPYGQYFFDLRRKDRRDAFSNARRLKQ
jgi:TnpA family transposase